MGRYLNYRVTLDVYVIGESTGETTGSCHPYLRSDIYNTRYLFTLGTILHFLFAAYFANSSTLDGTLSTEVTSSPADSTTATNSSQLLILIFDQPKDCSQHVTYRMSRICKSSHQALKHLAKCISFPSQKNPRLFGRLKCPHFWCDHEQTVVTMAMKIREPLKE